MNVYKLTDINGTSSFVVATSVADAMKVFVGIPLDDRGKREICRVELHIGDVFCDSAPKVIGYEVDPGFSAASHAHRLLHAQCVRTVPGDIMVCENHSCKLWVDHYGFVHFGGAPDYVLRSR